MSIDTSISGSVINLTQGNPVIANQFLVPKHGDWTPYVTACFIPGATLLSNEHTERKCSNIPAAHIHRYAWHIEGKDGVRLANGTAPDKTTDVMLMALLRAWQQTEIVFTDRGNFDNQGSFNVNTGWRSMQKPAVRLRKATEPLDTERDRNGFQHDTRDAYNA